jgi:hypothetical protein
MLKGRPAIARFAFPPADDALSHQPQLDHLIGAIY